MFTVLAAGPAAAHPVCSGGEVTCFAEVADVAVRGFTPSDLQSAYQIDPFIAGTPTVAVVDAYAYADLESDLAAYRAQFALPACTSASGCLTIVNQQGASSPLPGPAPTNDDWTVETSLDVQMISAACPRCKILVVQANSDAFADLVAGQLAAVAKHPVVISDSWGATETADIAQVEPDFDHPGIAQFVATGDNGFDNGGAGPHYPSTSAHVIGVGGTSLKRASNARGWSETAWSQGGSSCSIAIPKPAWQGATACAFRAASDLAAVGDPATGVAVFNRKNGGWMVLGGTSAATPIVAAIAAATDSGTVTPDVLGGVTGLFDITTGANGTCGSVLCTAGVGWDGPTGYGTPSAAVIAGPPSVAITSPADGDTVAPGFAITATAVRAAEVTASIDGVDIGSAAEQAGPYSFTAPPLAAGDHVLELRVHDVANVAASTQIHITVDDAAAGCAASGGGGGASSGLGALLVGLAIALPRRRRARYGASSGASAASRRSRSGTPSRW